MKALFLFLVAVAVSVAPQVVSAQEGNEGWPENAVSCFDYYTFGSVQVDVAGAVASVAPGTTLALSGNMHNDNSYPVVDGAVYMKVFRLGDDGSRPENGYDMVHQDFVADDVQLPALGTLPTAFTWDVPAFLPHGAYRAVFFFSSAKKFNLLGLPFTDDVVGNSFDFSVIGDTEDRVYLRKDTATLNGEPFRFAAVNAPISAKDAAEVEVDLSNPTDLDENIPVTWKLYKWDQQDESTLIEEHTQTVAIAAGTRERLSFTVEDTTTSAYLLVVEAMYRDVSSVLDVRIGRQNVPTMRINFPAVTSYPLTAGARAHMFSCLHVASNLDLVQGGKLVLSLSDEEGTLIHSYTYEGPVTGRMMAVEDSFTPNTTYETFTLQADLYRDDVLVDAATMHYTCEALDACTVGDEEEVPVVPVDQAQSDAGGVMFALVLLVVVIVVGYIAWAGRQTKATPKHVVDDRGKDDTDESMTPPPSAPPAAIMIALVFGAGLMMLASSAEASSVVCGTNFVGTMYSARIVENPGNMTYSAAVVDPQVSVTYTTNIYNADTNALIAKDEAIQVGTNIRFETVRGDVSYNIAGYYYDTPYGEWVTNAAHPGGAMGTEVLYGPLVPGGALAQIGQCDNRYYWGVSSGVDMFAPFSVHPEDPVRTTTGTAGLSCVGDTCMVTSAGTIETHVSFPSTYGYFYRDESLWGDSYGVLTDAGGTVTVPGFTCHSSWNLAPLASYRADITAGPVTPHKMVIPECVVDYDIVAFDSATTTVRITSCDTTGGGTNSGYVSEAQRYRVAYEGTADEEHRCGIDWDMDDVVDVWSDAGYAYPAENQDILVTWATEGSHTFRVRCQEKRSGQWSRPDDEEPTVVIVNKPPSMPVVSTVVGNTFQLDDLQTFDVYAVDPDGDTVQYLVDWNLDGAADAWLPDSTSYVPSATVLQTAHTWSGTPYPHAFNVAAVDSDGDQSGWYTHNVTIVATNATPDAPTVTHVPAVGYVAGEGETGVAQSFEVTAGDLDGGDIFYGVDWDTDGFVDLYTPDLSSLTFDSATPHVFQQTWLSEGSKAFKVLARDSHGALSPWTDVMITISSAPLPVVDGTCGPVHDDGMCVTSLNMTHTGLCTAGLLANFTEHVGVPGSWTWECMGDNSPVNDTCSVTDCSSSVGVCGTVAAGCGAPLDTDPNLCSVGTMQNYSVTEGSTSWECQGVATVASPCVINACIVPLPQ